MPAAPDVSWASPDCLRGFVEPAGCFQALMLPVAFLHLKTIQMAGICIGFVFLILLLFDRRFAVGERAFRLLRPTLYVLSLAGLGLSGYLMYLHALNMQGGAMPHVCGGRFDCTTVLQSSYAMIGGQVPVAALGVAYFMILSVWLMFVGRLPGKTHRAYVAPAGLAALGALHSAYLIHAMGWKLHAWCSFCLATHTVNFLLLIGLWAQWLKGRAASQRPEAPADAERQMWKVPTMALLTGGSAALSLLLILVAGAFYVGYQSKAKELATMQQDVEYQRWQFLRTPPEQLATTPDDPVRGPAGAAHTVVMFGDFQCPGCAQTDKALREVQNAVGGRFRLVYKHYPQGKECNAAMAGSNKHAFACMAAEAAEAARILGGEDAFWKMHDALYDNQGRLAEKPYDQLAREIGLDPVAFERVMSDTATRQRIERDVSLAKGLKVVGTPTLFLDGRRVSLDIVTDIAGNETDLPKTTEHWQHLLAAADVAAATQPALTAAATQPEPTANGQPKARTSQPLASLQ